MLRARAPPIDAQSSVVSPALVPVGGVVWLKSRFTGAEAETRMLVAQVAQAANQESQGLLPQTTPTLGAPSQSAAAGATISLGMSMQEVQGILGSPRRSATIGAKRIEVYQDFKVTYLNGRVTDVQ